jgi:hypothetical protein
VICGHTPRADLNYDTGNDIYYIYVDDYFPVSLAFGSASITLKSSGDQELISVVLVLLANFFGLIVSSSFHENQNIT